MTKEWIWAIVTGLSGILLGWIAHIKTARKDAVDAATHDTAIDTALKSDVDYIKRGVDDIKLDMRAQASKVEGIDRRVTRVEESAKSAHHRLDRLESHNN